MSYLKDGGQTPPTPEDLFGVNDLSYEEKLKDWSERLERFRCAIDSGDEKQAATEVKD